MSPIRRVVCPILLLVLVLLSREALANGRSGESEAPEAASAVAPAAPTVAAVARTPIPLADRTFSLRADFGAFSPLGFGGVSATVAPRRWLLLEGGVGYGLTGLQLSVMPKVALGTVRNRALLGVGYSAGLPLQSEHGDTTFHFANFEAGYEHRTPSGLSFVVATGATMVLAGQRYERNWFSNGSSLNDYRGVVGPMVRFGVGYWF